MAAMSEITYWLWLTLITVDGKGNEDFKGEVISIRLCHQEQRCSAKEMDRRHLCRTLKNQSCQSGHGPQHSIPIFPGLFIVDPLSANIFILCILCFNRVRTEDDDLLQAQRSVTEQKWIHISSFPLKKTKSMKMSENNWRQWMFFTSLEPITRWRWRCFGLPWQPFLYGQNQVIFQSWTTDLCVKNIIPV